MAKRATSRREVPRSLAAARFLSPHARAAWRRDLVFCQIEDLNALYDAVVLEMSGREGTATRAARARARALQTAARFVPESSLAAARAYLATEVETPGDQLGPAVILGLLASHEARVRSWLAGLPSELTNVLRIVQEDA